MNALYGYVATWGREVVAGWNRFWFTAVDTATLSLIRILAGAMLLYTHLVWSLRLTEFFGANGWLSPDAVGLAQAQSYAWSYFWYVDSPAALWTLHVAALIVFALLTVGLFTRVVSVLAFLAALSYVGRVQGALFGLDQINVMLAMYLMVGPAGARYSLDRVLARRRGGASAGEPAPSVAANIAIRLIQVHMCIIYMFAGMGKLMGPGWWDGTAMWMALGNYEYQSMDLTWMAEWPRLINLLTHVTIFWELFYVALVWPRLTRPVVLLLAVPLHLGIGICLGMMTFGLVMLIGNLAFVPPEVVRAILQWHGAGEGGGVPQPAKSQTQAPLSQRRAPAARSGKR